MPAGAKRLRLRFACRISSHMPFIRALTCLCPFLVPIARPENFAEATGVALDPSPAAARTRTNTECIGG